MYKKASDANIIKEGFSMASRSEWKRDLERLLTPIASCRLACQQAEAQKEKRRQSSNGLRALGSCLQVACSASS